MTWTCLNQGSHVVRSNRCSWYPIVRWHSLLREHVMGNIWQQYRKSNGFDLHSQKWPARLYRKVFAVPGRSLHRHPDPVCVQADRLVWHLDDISGCALLSAGERWFYRFGEHLWFWDSHGPAPKAGSPSMLVFETSLLMLYGAHCKQDNTAVHACMQHARTCQRGLQTLRQCYLCQGRWGWYISSLPPWPSASFDTVPVCWHARCGVETFALLPNRGSGSPTCENWASQYGSWSAIQESYEEVQCWVLFLHHLTATVGTRDRKC